MTYLRLLSATIIGVVFSTTPVHASVSVLDQASEMAFGVPGWAISNRVAQTVTIGISGKLDKIGIRVSQSNSRAIGDLWVDLWSVAADGTPEIDYLLSSPLASSLVLNSDIPLASEVQDSIVLAFADFSSLDLSFNVDDRLAIVPRRTDLSNWGSPPWMLWHGGSLNLPDQYSRGDFYLNTIDGWEQRTGDFGFQTFVLVPEPNAALILAIGILLALANRRESFVSSYR